jgi:hypothetical protein
VTNIPLSNEIVHSVTNSPLKSTSLLSGLFVTKWTIRHWVDYSSPSGLFVTEWTIRHWVDYSSLSGLFVTKWTIRHWMDYSSLSGLFVTEWTISLLSGLFVTEWIIPHWVYYPLLYWHCLIVNFFLNEQVPQKCNLLKLRRIVHSAEMSI